LATRKLAIKYGVLATILALGIIGTSMYFNNSNSVTTTPAGQTNFYVMLTDPPNVPRGTTALNVTYSSIQLNVVPASGSSYWVASQESGRVDLLSLVNVSQTIASVNLPSGATVNKLQLKLSSAEAKINGVVHQVTLLSDDLLISIKDTKLNGTKTGALIDLRPTLVQIDATNSTGGQTSYYVLSPSASAIVKSNMSEDQCKVGSRWNIGKDDNGKLDKAYQNVLKNVTVTQSSLSVNGNVTTFSVTLKNSGKSNATLFSLSLNGEFNVTSPFAASVKQNGYPGHGTIAPGSNATGQFAPSGEQNGNSGRGMFPPGNMKNNGGRMFQWPTSMGRPEMIPFAINGESLVPMFGDRIPAASVKQSKLVLKPGESVTLTFSGVISLNVDGRLRGAHVAVTPVKAKSYSISLMGWGFKTFTVKAS